MEGRGASVAQTPQEVVHVAGPPGGLRRSAGQTAEHGAALCGCGRVESLTCPERASVVRASNSAERSVRPFSGQVLRAPPRSVRIFGRDLLV